MNIYFKNLPKTTLREERKGKKATDTKRVFLNTPKKNHIRNLSLLATYAIALLGSPAVLASSTSLKSEPIYEFQSVKMSYPKAFPAINIKNNNGLWTSTGSMALNLPSETVWQIFQDNPSLLLKEMLPSGKFKTLKSTPLTSQILVNYYTYKLIIDLKLSPREKRIDFEQTSPKSKGSWAGFKVLKGHVDLKATNQNKQKSNVGFQLVVNPELFFTPNFIFEKLLESLSQGMLQRFQKKIAQESLKIKNQNLSSGS